MRQLLRTQPQARGCLGLPGPVSEAPLKVVHNVRSVRGGLKDLCLVSP